MAWRISALAAMAAAFAVPVSPALAQRGVVKTPAASSGKRTGVAAPVSLPVSPVPRPSLSLPVTALPGSFALPGFSAPSAAASPVAAGAAPQALPLLVAPAAGAPGEAAQGGAGSRALPRSAASVGRHGERLMENLPLIFDNAASMKRATSEAVRVFWNGLGKPGQGADVTTQRNVLDSQPGRLSSDVRPEAYDLHIKVDPESAAFSGTVRIAVDLSRPVRELTFHSLGLDLRSASVDGRPVSLAGLRSDAKFETVTLPLETALGPGRATLEVAYSGTLNRQMKGFYQSRAQHAGKSESYAFTHLEATEARRMFPSFDEPSLKSKFRLTLTAPEGLTALSNMPAEKQSTEAGWRTTVFGETPKMSTYLLAVAVARLEGKSRTVAGTKITVWTLPQDAGQADFALDAAEAGLTRLNDYFGLPYQLPKMDLVAVPDFAAGAMENWGALFFRDSALLVDPELSSTRAKRRVAEVVVHEIVHQWFGNLVTMDWWDNLWLNEAFATWLAYKIVDDWKPEWRTWLDFEQRKQSPLAIDSLRSTRAINSKAATSSEIRAMFDPLTYSKGGTILRMIEGFLGDEAFREGIRLYIRKHQYGNTVAADLWRALGEASGQPIERLAKDWLEQPGYPRVSASLEDGRTVHLTQGRFRADGARDFLGARWAVPVVLLYEDSEGVKTHRVLLEGAAADVRLPGRGPVKWVYPNRGERGFYRVHLDERLRSSLIGSSARLDPLERMGALGNLWAEARAGELPIGDFLEALKGVSGEPSRIVLEKAAEYLLELDDLLESPDERAGLAKVANELFGAHWRRLGWKGGREDDETRLSRAAALLALGAVGRPPRLLAEAEKRLERYLADPAALEPTLIGPVLTLGAQNGGPARFDAYLARWRAATTPEQRDHFYKGLSQFRQPELARRLLEMTLTEEIRPQDMWKPLQFLLRGPATQGVAWDFVKAHWPALRAKAGPAGSTRIVEGLNAVASADRLADVKEFFGVPANQEPSAKRALAQSLEFSELALRFRETQAERLRAWLNDVHW